MPIKFTNALVIFQKLINNIFMLFLNITCIYYLNDILIYSTKLKNYKKNIKAIIQILQNTNLKVKLLKCKFKIQKVTFLKYVIFTKRIKINSAKIAFILK